MDIIVTFIGLYGVGKSSILNTYVDPKYNVCLTKTTLALDFIQFKITVENVDYNVIIYDTAGSEQYDLIEKQIITMNHVVQFIETCGIKKYFETSAKKNINVRNAINDVIISFINAKQMNIKKECWNDHIKKECWNDHILIGVNDNVVNKKCCE